MSKRNVSEAQLSPLRMQPERVIKPKRTPDPIRGRYVDVVQRDSTIDEIMQADDVAMSRADLLKRRSANQASLQADITRAEATHAKQLTVITEKCLLRKCCKNECNKKVRATNLEILQYRLKNCTTEASAFYRSEILKFRGTAQLDGEVRSLDKGQFMFSGTKVCAQFWRSVVGISRSEYGRQVHSICNGFHGDDMSR